MKDSKAGGCLCGAVRYTLAEVPTSYGACHCGICRKWVGGVEMGVQVMPGGLSFVEDRHLKTYPSSNWAERGFCDICGSSLFWRLTASGPMQGMMSLSVGSLDDSEALTFDSEVFIDHKPASYEFAGDRKRMTEADIMAMMSEGAPE